MTNDAALQTTLTLAQVAKFLGVELYGENIHFSRISINTRTLQPGDLFIAIKGESFDAHQFIAQAEARGACGLIVEKATKSKLPMIIVEDARLALGKVAALWRTHFSLPVVAVTGSCGKTTVKEMISAIFNVRYGSNVLSTQGNLNNDIGVPLTLMRLKQQHQAAVIELGANHLGEIAYLVNLVQPDIALITNCTHAHIEGFGSIEGVAKAKGEIYTGLVKDGVAIINADDEFAEYWLNLCQSISQQSDRALKIQTFGINNSADFRATYSHNELELNITIDSDQGSINLMMQQLGKHNVYNALTATAVCLAAGCDLNEVKQGLERFNNIAGRLQAKQGINGSLIFDDTYNANPGSVKAGIEAIQHIPGSTMVVLGDMGELGNSAQSLHYQLGLDIAELDVAKLFTVGPLSQAICEGFNHARSKQKKAANALCFRGKDELLKALCQQIDAKSVVMIKGSRKMGMESIVKQLEAENSNQNETTRGCHSCC